MASLTKLKQRRLTSAVGALIEGVDLRRPLDPDAVQAVRQALNDNGVIFFQNQELSDGQFEAFIGKFGELQVESYGAAPPAAVTVGNLTATRRSTAVWHADVTWIPRPPVATAIRAVQLPSVGGDTCWASMEAAYNALSEPFRRMLDGLTAVHSMQPTLDREPMLAQTMRARAEGTVTETAHPVVRVHPETGRKALYVSECSTTRIVELSPAESTSALSLLFEHIRSPDFMVRWTWTPNDLAFWDNRSVQHYAVPDYQEDRVMQRAQLLGDEVPRGPAN